MNYNKMKQVCMSLVLIGSLATLSLNMVRAEGIKNPGNATSDEYSFTFDSGLEDGRIYGDHSETVSPETESIHACASNESINGSPVYGTNDEFSESSEEPETELIHAGVSDESIDGFSVDGTIDEHSAKKLPADDSTADLPTIPNDDLSSTPDLSDESVSDRLSADVSIADESVPEREKVVGAAIRRDIEDGLYLLVPKLNSSRCISVAGNSKAAGANVHLVTKNGGFAQAFYVRKVKGTSRYTFVNYHTGQAVGMENGVSGSAVSANAIQNPLTEAQNQQWVLEDMGNGYLQLRVCGTNLVMDLPAAQTAAGTNIQVYRANQTDAQQWKLVKAYGKIAAEARLEDAGLSKGYYRISPSDKDDLSVDVTFNSKDNDANIRIFTKMNTGAQIFRIVPAGDGTYTVNGYNSGKYLDCANAKAGSNVFQATSRSSTYQRWYILKDMVTGKYVIRNKNGSHVVLCAEGNEKGANVGQGAFEGTVGQYWKLAKIAGSSIHVEPRDGIYEFRSGLNGNLCLDVAAGSSLNNANIQLYTANGSDAQRFAITGSGYGAYKVVNVNSMRAMHLKGNSTASGTNVLQYRELNSTAQRWKITWNSRTGGYQVQPYGKTTCLDVAGGKAVNGANVQAATVNNSIRQMWTLNRVSSYDGKYHMKVMSDGTSCTFKVYQVVGGVFTEKLGTSGYIGRNGAGKTVEGDGKTPIGTFTVGKAYGIANDPGSLIPYKKVTNDMYWCGRSDSPYYNTLINAAKSGAGDEHLIEYTESYQYLLDIGYNTACTPHLGSAIFLHCSRNQPTAGCIAIPKEDMARVLRMITPGTKISIE